MGNFRERFTKWYYRKGYRMEWRTNEMVFHCPVWVRPLVYFFFSPSAYYGEAGFDLGRAFESGLDASLISVGTLHITDEDTNN
jgi:hypothetical protein